MDADGAGEHLLRGCGEEGWYEELREGGQLLECSVRMQILLICLHD